MNEEMYNALLEKFEYYKAELANPEQAQLTTDAEIAVLCAIANVLRYAPCTTKKRP